MDSCAAILLAFPPTDQRPDDSTYDKAIKAQLVKLSDLIKKASQILTTNGIELLQVLDPAEHSLSYLAVIHTLCIPSLAERRDVILEKLVTFLHTFDPIQLRYAGSHLLDLLNLVGSDTLLPPSVAVRCLSTAILRLDPTGSILTSTHTLLAKLAFKHGHIVPALPVIDKDIVYFPGMANHSTMTYLCNASLWPPEYINKENGLTNNLKTASVLEYDLLCGMIYCARKDWAKAQSAFERVISFPTRDQGTSKIMSEAFKKWILVSLLLNGRCVPLPSYASPGPTKQYTLLGKLYKDIGAVFETPNAVELKVEAEKNAQVWREDNNVGLIREVLGAYQKWQVLNLQRVYTKISIGEIRAQTKSAQTGECLKKIEEVEALIQNMVISGMLKGVIETSNDGTKFLTFLPPSELSEREYAQELSRTGQKLTQLQGVYKYTNERLSTHKEYIKHLTKEQQRRGTDKDHANDPTLGGFESHVDDEDLMGGS